MPPFGRRKKPSGPRSESSPSRAGRPRSPAFSVEVIRPPPESESAFSSVVATQQLSTLPVSVDRDATSRGGGPDFLPVPFRWLVVTAPRPSFRHGQLWLST